jgi:hypothetical protein
MTKFFLNLLLQISKAFVDSKIQFLFEKKFSSEFGPSQPASPVLARSSPQAAALARSAHPGLCGLGVIAKSRLYFEFAQPSKDAFFLCHRQAGPTCQLHLPPSAGRSRPHRCLTSPLSATPRHPASTSRCRVKELTPSP